MSTDPTIRSDDEEAEDADTLRLTEDIAQTRATMSGAIEALETRLAPSEVRGKVDVELHHIEEKVRSVVREQLTEAKTLLREEMNEAESKIKTGLAEARDAVKKDLNEAMTGAKRSARAATLGKVEDLATTIGDSMNDTRDTLIDTIRQNPLPAAIAGVGLAWLFMNRSSSARRGAAPSRAVYSAGFVDARGLPYANAAQASSRPLGRAADKVGQAVSGATGAAGEALHHATDAASGALHDASDAASSALHGASDLAGRAASQTSHLAGSLVHGIGDASTSLAHGASDAASYVADGAVNQVRRVERGFQDTLRGNPLAVGAAAVAVGAVIGFALPRTASEDALMGEAREELFHKAGAAAHDASAAIGSLTEQVGEKAKDMLGDEGSASA